MFSGKGRNIFLQKVFLPFPEALSLFLKTFNKKFWKRRGLGEGEPYSKGFPPPKKTSPCLQRSVLAVRAERAGELVACEEEATFVEGAAHELKADG